MFGEHFNPTIQSEGLSKCMTNYLKFKIQNARGSFKWKGIFWWYCNRILLFIGTLSKLVYSPFFSKFPKLHLKKKTHRKIWELYFSSRRRLNTQKSQDNYNRDAISKVRLDIRGNRTPQKGGLNIAESHFPKCMNTSVSRFTNLICSTMLEKMATFVFVWERRPQSCLSFDAEFANKNKIFPNTSVCWSNCLQTKAFINWGPTINGKEATVPEGRE